MRLPRPDEYRGAVHKPEIAFRDPVLKRATPKRHPVYHLPSAVSGGFALTFNLEAGGERFAVRCFHRPGDHLQERYAAVADFIHRTRLEFLVDVRYLAEGIFVSGQWYPIVCMPWISGSPLNAWLDKNHDEPRAIERVRGEILGSVTVLLRHGAAHGDLQHGNILIGDDGRVRLIDYDGMYLKALSHLGSAEGGHRNYQHPDRGKAYDESLDLFAAAVIDISLEAVKQQPSLWGDFNSEENLLFSAVDFAAPEDSELFARLARLPGLNERVGRLRDACEADFGQVAKIIKGEVARTGERRAFHAAALKGPVVIEALHRQKLLAAEGDEVTVVGRVLRANTVNIGLTQATFVNFGDHRRGAFTIVAWGKASTALVAHLGDVSLLNGAWITTTGLLDVYRHAKYGLTPQIELLRPRSLRVIDRREADTLIASTKPAPPTSPQTRTSGVNPKPSATTGTPVDQLQYNIGKLWSNPNFKPAASAGRPQTAKPPPPTARPAQPNVKPSAPSAKPAQQSNKPPPSKARQAPPRQTSPPIPPPLPPRAPPYAPMPTAAPKFRFGDVPTAVWVLIGFVAVSALLFICCCTGLMARSQ